MAKVCKPDDKNPPLFPSAAAAMAADIHSPVSAHNAMLLDDTSAPPGVGCLWCWQVAAAGDGGLGMPRFQDFLPQPLLAAFRLDKEESDYLDILGGDSFPGVSAEWSAPNSKGQLCNRAPLFFDAWNASGSKVWGRAAAGSIVVARRGPGFFETITRNAEKAGAVAVVILDDRDEWDEDFELSLNEIGRMPPRIPAVLVPKRAESVLTAGQKCYAVIARR